MSRVLLIGNGPAALAKEVGEEIDNFKGDVVRFNNYTVRGYEKWVGTRTDIWISNNRHDHLINESHKQRWFISPRFDEPTEKTIAFMRAQRMPIEYHSKAGYAMRYFHPSTGAIATTFFIEQGHEVWLWGFDYLNTRVAHHYNSDKIVRGPDHSQDAEWLFFNNLLEEGRIKYLAHDPTKESIPIIRQPVPCGKDDDVSWYRESAHEAWYLWIALQNKAALPKTCLDVGAGMCGGMRVLEGQGLRVTGFEVDERLRDKHPKLVIADTLEVFESKSFDIVTCVDVIEHVVEDIPFMEQLRRIARERIYITTPNYTRSRCGNIAHCREYTIAQFMNSLKPDEIWSGSPDGSIHRTLVLRKLGDWIVDLSPEGPDNTRRAHSYFAYKHKVPLDVRFNYTVDGEEWAHIAAVFNNGGDR